MVIEKLVCRFIKHRKIDMKSIILERANIIAKVREETPNDVLRRFSKTQLASAPRSFSKHIPALRQAKFLETGVRDGMAFARTPDGYIFYGYTSQNNHRRAYQFVRDLLPSTVTEDTFLVCLDVAQRYATDFTWPPEELLPPKSGTVVECGAYLGYKTIRFAKELVPEGQVLAIEMMPNNTEILRRNIEENSLSHRVSIIEAGIWKEPGKLTVKGKGRQRNTLVKLEKLQDNTGIEVRVDTLDNLLNEWGIKPIDLLFLTVNGAEIEAIEGLCQCLPQVKGIFVAAPYERDGNPNSDICRVLLKERGCRILSSSNLNRVIALGLQS
jgi:FkbM family methyltransferase